MTSKDYLSQEEIDALLRQSSDEPDTTKSASSPMEELNEYLSSIEQDALGEIGNITFGSAATALSTLLGRKVDITTPKVSLIKRSELEDQFPKPHVAVSVKYVDGFQGINSLVIKTADAQTIADLMLGGTGIVEPGQELNEIHVSAVQEAMNQMMGSSATSMSTIFNRFVNISPPGIDILNVSNGEGVDRLPPDDLFIKIAFRLTIGDLIDSQIMQLLPIAFAQEMVTTLMGGASEPEPVPVAASAVAAPAAHTPPPAAAQAPVQPQGQPAQQPMYDPYQQQPAYDPYQQQQPMGYPMNPQGMPMMPPQGIPGQPGMPMMPPAAMQGGYGMPGYGAPGYAMPPQTYGGMPNRNVNVQPVQFGGLQGGGLGQTDESNLNLLLDIPLKVTVELGRTQKQIKDILELSQGSIIELDKLAGEPVDILVNNKLIAKGEVVVIDENFGVRVTDIVSQWDRIQKLQ
ncbi:flagellar motor switch protein FliN/FliY [Paenibacillus phyllosphaerae]|uniref:Flagellar motor switch protein FliN/FliY n=1 Tax=Paenibacillus phyllosphaerae TaxID=274593 RepID=A0A7W5AWH2_9BACL|nr:flagellar motor switch phosphatase FliY [Paenibacillus phyllosphaerae]MBB3109401.1 flagellar motor switch protein FliN/FliY [Paenibacillus phyllosphaerae]